MTQVSIGPPLSAHGEAELRQAQRASALAEAEQAAKAIDLKIAGMQKALQDRLDEIARLRGELED